MTKKIKSESLVDKAYDQIKQDLAQGNLKPGEKINFKDLVDRYGISETPIKQALNRLVIEDLVVSIPRKGMYVKEVSVQDFKEIIDIRYALESFLAPIIIEAVTYQPQYLERLEENIKCHYRAIEEGTDSVEDFIRIYNIDHEFHSIFMKASGHSKALQVYESIGAHTFSYFLYNKKPKSKLIDGVKEHEEILKALKNQDLTSLQESIKLHMTNAKASLNFMFNNVTNII